MATLAQAQGAVGRRIVAGVIGGVAGGLAFGALMGMMGMLPMVAGLVGSNSAVVGFIVHMVLSALIGAGFGLAFGAQSHSYAQGAGWGLAYGAIWWVLGPMILMPLLMGMGPQFGAAFTTPMLMSLMGHLVYGVVTGAVYVWYTQR
jgi:uncharacterized membrane protein YagU involved in acid resistance